MAFDLQPVARIDVGYLSLPPSPSTASQAPQVLTPALRGGVGVTLLPGLDGKVVLGVLPAETAGRQGVGIREASVTWRPAGRLAVSGGQVRLPWQELEDRTSFGQWFPGGLMGASGLLEPAGLGASTALDLGDADGAEIGAAVAAVASEGWLGGAGSRPGPIVPAYWGRGPALHGRLRARVPGLGTWALGGRFNFADDQQVMAMVHDHVGPVSWHLSGGASSSAAVGIDVAGQAELRLWWTGDAAPQATGSWVVLSGRGLRGTQPAAEASASWEAGIGVGAAPDDHTQAVTGLTWRKRADAAEPELWWRTAVSWRLREDD
ncbi:MAG: hypothetical protein VKO64_00550 [Candidatus Sericytochromatia bacterium]|nr:hypothetical protein [Candidatus Sericytochromatia bacterium]